MAVTGVECDELEPVVVAGVELEETNDIDLVLDKVADWLLDGRIDVLIVS